MAALECRVRHWQFRRNCLNIFNFGEIASSLRNFGEIASSLRNFEEIASSDARRPLSRGVPFRSRAY